MGVCGAPVVRELDVEAVEVAHVGKRISPKVHATAKGEQISSSALHTLARNSLVDQEHHPPTFQRLRRSSQFDLLHQRQIPLRPDKPTKA